MHLCTLGSTIAFDIIEKWILSAIFLINDRKLLWAIGQFLHFISVATGIKIYWKLSVK